MIRGILLGFEKIHYKVKETGEEKCRCDAYLDLGQISDSAGVGHHTATVTAWNEHCDWFFDELFNKKYLGKSILIDTFGFNNTVAKSHIVMPDSTK